MTKKPADLPRCTTHFACDCIQAQLSHLQAELDILKSPSDGRCMEIVALREQVKKLQADNDRLEEECCKDTERYFEDREQIDKLKAENERLLGVVNTVDAHAADVERDNFELERDLSREREKCARLEDVIGKAMDVCPAWIRDMFIAALSSAPSEKEVKS